MIVLSIKNTVIRIDFTFFCVLAMFFFFDKGSGVCAFLSCLFHECGHLLALLMFAAPVNEVYLYGGGIRITAPTSSLNKLRRVAVLLAGCLFNIILSVIFHSLHMYHPMMLNIMLAVLNLLPFRCLDGGQLLTLMAEYIGKPTGKWLMALQIISVAVIAFALVRYDIRPDATFAVFAVYQLVIGISDLVVCANNY